MHWLILCVLVFRFYDQSESFDLKDVGKSVTDVTKGVIGKIPDVIPSAEDFFQSAKNVIAGYPFDLAFRAINSFCESHSASFGLTSTVMNAVVL